MTSRAAQTQNQATEPGESALEHAAGLFKALADPLRLQLVAITRNAPAGEVCFCDLIDVFGIPQSSLSHHLRVLVTAGILDRERRGTWSWYRPHPAALEALQDALHPDGRLTQMICDDIERRDSSAPAEQCLDPRATGPAS